MKHTTLLRIAGLAAGSALLLAVVAPSFAQPPAGRGGPGGPRGGRGPEAMFEQIDKNADGKVTADEAPELLWERLQRADADGDGAVTIEELQEARPMGGPGGRRGGPGGPGGPGGRRGAPPDAATVIEKLDEDGSGELTEGEVPEQIWARMQAADADGNGAVTLEELEKHHADRPRGGGGRGPEALFEKADANADGKLTEDEVPEHIWARISQADDDGDGALTLEELQAHRPGLGGRGGRGGRGGGFGGGRGQGGQGFGGGRGYGGGFGRGAR